MSLECIVYGLNLIIIIQNWWGTHKHQTIKPIQPNEKQNQRSPNACPSYHVNDCFVGLYIALDTSFFYDTSIRDQNEN